MAQEVKQTPLTIEIPFEEYYAFDLVPTYWKELAKRLDTGRMMIQS